MRHAVLSRTRLRNAEVPLWYDMQFLAVICLDMHQYSCGAGRENRTPVCALARRRSTTKPCPQITGMIIQERGWGAILFSPLLTGAPRRLGYPRFSNGREADRSFMGIFVVTIIFWCTFVATSIFLLENLAAPPRRRRGCGQHKYAPHICAPARIRTWNSSSEDCCDIRFTTRATT